jgi:hypothetical protein
MTTFTSNHNISNENKTIQHKHCPIEIQQWKNKNKITVNDDSDNDIIDDVIINYWHEEFQLIENDEIVLFNLNGWLNDEHLVGIMQMLYIKKL